MTETIIVIYFGVFAAIGSLPLIFFRRGSFNACWWVTAIPFFVAPTALLAAFIGWMEPTLPPESTYGRCLLALSVPPALGCLVLLLTAVNEHRTAPALWHQDDDEPARLVRSGPYRRIRHPFYAAFLLALTGTAMAAPHPATVACLLYGSVAMYLTAVREERRLLRSRHGNEYREYMSATGRFAPRSRGVVR